MNWYKVAFPPSVEQLNLPANLIRWSRERYLALDDKKNFCVFAAMASDYTVYFSPVAAGHCSDLLKELGAGECEAPTPDLLLLKLEIGESECQGLIRPASDSPVAT
jgi:hypothetical protein